MCTGIIAFVFLLIFFFKSIGHIFNDSSIDVILGIAPISRIASIVAIKLNDCVITSSPLFTFNDFKPIFIAAVPDETIKQYLTLKYFLHKFSNSLT